MAELKLALRDVGGKVKFRDKETDFNIRLQKRARRINLGESQEQVDEPLAGNVVGKNERRLRGPQLQRRSNDVIHVAVPEKQSVTFEALSD